MDSKVYTTFVHMAMEHGKVEAGAALERHLSPHHFVEAGAHCFHLVQLDCSSGILNGVMSVLLDVFL